MRDIERHVPERIIRLQELGCEMYGPQFPDEFNSRPAWSVVQNPGDFDVMLGVTLLHHRYTKGVNAIIFDAESGHYPDPGFRSVHHIADPCTVGRRKVVGFSENFSAEIDDPEGYEDYIGLDSRGFLIGGSAVEGAFGKVAFWD